MAPQLSQAGNRMIGVRHKLKTGKDKVFSDFSEITILRAAFNFPTR